MTAEFTPDKLESRNDWEEPFLEFLHEHAGLNLHQHQMDSFHSQVLNACERFGYAHPMNYLQSLKSSPDELEYLISGTTIGETYFFRDDTQIAFIRDKWLPQIIQQRRNRGENSLRVWSAGCATGEELYTIAILLAEILSDIENWDIQLIGSDISNSIINAAEGIYSQWSLRATSDEMKQKYFTPVGKGFVLNSQIRKMASFQHLNLNNDPFPVDITGFNGIDLILCRNVFIYFSHPVVKHVMKKFSNALSDEGVLILAPADIVDVSTEFSGLQYVQDKEVFYYCPAGKSLTESSIQTLAPLTNAAGTISLNAEQAVLTPQVTPASTRPTADVKESDIQQMITSGHSQTALEQIDKAFKNGAISSEMYRLKALAFASLGKISEALAVCSDCLKRDNLDPQSWFLHAILLLDNEETELAIKSLQKALYLDWNFPEVHARLGLLSAQKGDSKTALEHFLNAREALANGNKNTLLCDGSGMSYRELDELLATDMNILAGFDTGTNQT